MPRKNAPLWNGTIIGLLGLLALGLAACNQRQQAAAPPQTPDTVARPESIQPAAPPSTHEQAEATKVPPTTPPTPPRPLTSEEIERLWMRPELASKHYAIRLEAIRSILHRLRSHGQLDEARVALVVLLGEVEKQEGRAKAQEVAFREASNLGAQKDYAAAVMAYRLMLDRYPDAALAAEAQHQLGTSCLELHDYVAAEQAWQSLIEEHDDSPLAPWGWRKLALAQLLQGQFDTCLATLELMAAKYPGTEYANYACMRRGYVYVAAGRPVEARQAYQAFLENCPRSKYCVLAREQMTALDEAEREGMDVLAQVNDPGK